jgi:hypothetical protein
VADLGSQFGIWDLGFEISTDAMKFLGYTLTKDQASPPPPVTRSLSTAFLRGDDVDQPGTLLVNAYEQVVWVYRAINVLAEQVANIPFLFSSGERGRENLITSGPLLDFYDHPHPHINRFQYWELRIMWLMLRGECFRLPIFDDSFSSSSSSSGLLPIQQLNGSTIQRVRTAAALNPF